MEMFTKTNVCLQMHIYTHRLLCKYVQIHANSETLFSHSFTSVCLAPNCHVCCVYVLSVYFMRLICYVYMCLFNVSNALCVCLCVHLMCLCICIVSVLCVYLMSVYLMCLYMRCLSCFMCLLSVLCVCVLLFSVTLLLFQLFNLLHSAKLTHNHYFSPV